MKTGHKPTPYFKVTLKHSVHLIATLVSKVSFPSLQSNRNLMDHKTIHFPFGSLTHSLTTLTTFYELPWLQFGSQLNSMKVSLNLRELNFGYLLVKVSSNGSLFSQLKFHYNPSKRNQVLYSSRFKSEDNENFFLQFRNLLVQKKLVKYCHKTNRTDKNFFDWAIKESSSLLKVGAIKKFTICFLSSHPSLEIYF